MGRQGEMVMATDKSFYNKKIKVSQSTIDDIKKMGMAKALKLAGQNSKASQGGLVKEYQEATKRLYGQKRFSAATGSSMAKPTGTYQTGSAKNNKATYTTGSGVRQAAASKPAAKKDNTKSNILRGLGAVGAAALVLAASKNPAAAARAGSTVLAAAPKAASLAKKVGPIAGKISRKGPGTQMEFAKKAAENKMRQNITKRAGGIVTKRYNALGKEVGADLGFKPQSLRKAQPQLKTTAQKQAFMKDALAGKPIAKKAAPSITKKKMGKIGVIAGTSASNKQIKRK